MFANGCTLVPLDQAARHLRRRFWSALNTRMVYKTWRKLLGESKAEIDFDAYTLKAAAGAEIWLLVHGLRGDILGGFQLTGNKEHPIECVALYWYPGYTHHWEGNALIFEHLTRRLAAIQATSPTKLLWSQIRLLWCSYNRSNYDSYLRVPPLFEKCLVLEERQKQVA